MQNPPQKIYAIGNIELLQNKALAIVGTRKNTEYGEKCTKKFARQIAGSGITIVSGLALGVDSIAHRNSMKHKGKTIAVMGTGFKNIYPQENKKLFREILKNGGCIISEYPPETKLNKLNFPTRNRIIAGLSCGVLVTEARYRSGSSITAKYAKKQGKPIFCIPNRIGKVASAGTNNLIKQGANLVTNVNDILLKIGEKPIEKLDEKIEEEPNKERKAKHKKINNQYKEIYKTLEKKAITIEELAEKTNKSIIEINQKITIMELEGLIETCPGNIVKIKE